MPLIYLNRTYAYFYDYQGSHFIANRQYYSPQIITASPEAPTKKMVVMGDSLMAGTGSTTEQNSLAYLIGKGIDNRANIELYNLAWPGVGVSHVYAQQLAQAIELQPDYIVLMIGVNDLHNQMTDSDFRQHYMMILDGLTKKTKAKITIINIPHIGSDKILFVPWNFVFDNQRQRLNRIITGSAAVYNLKVIDLYSEFKEQFKKSSDLYGEDEFHPSDRGYALWANYLNANLNR